MSIRGLQNKTQDSKPGPRIILEGFFDRFLCGRVYRGLTIFSENDRFSLGKRDFSV